MSPRLPKYFKVLLSQLRSYFSTSGVLNAANGGTGTASAFVGGILATAYGGTATANTAAIANGSVKITCADTAPSSPTADDLWYETDTNILWFWNGTYWLSTELFTTTKTAVLSASSNEYLMAVQTFDAGTLSDIYLVDLVTVTDVLTTNDATKYWTIQTRRYAANGTATNIGSEISTGTTPDTVDVYTQHRVALNTLIDVSTDIQALETLVIKTSTPGNLLLFQTLTYRLAHP